MQVLFTHRAERGLRKSPDDIKRRVRAKVEGLKSEPMLGQPMLGEFRGLRRIVVGTFRLVYFFDKSSQTITVTAVEPRGGVYK